MSYTIGQVAKIMNLSTYTLRYYDKEGLLPFVKRTENGVRIFEEDDLHFLQVIFCLKNTGMPIEKIREFIKWADEGDATLQKRYHLFVERKSEVERQIAQLQEYKECIEYKCNYYKEALEAGTEAIHKNKTTTEMPLSKIAKFNKEDL